MRTHLWEVEHSYYCEEGNYFEQGCNTKYDSFADFLEESGYIDLDYNLLFRWDWKKGEEEEEGDTLSLFWMQQRKGKYVSETIKVTEADEPAVRAFLQRAFNHLAALWLPILFEPEVAEVKVPDV